MGTSLSFKPLPELASLIRTRQISPVDLVQELLQRIDAQDGELKSYITVTGERALREARAAEEDIAAGRYRGPLHGIPVCHKDNIWTAGVRTTAHSLAYARFVPSQDATAVRRLSEAGMVLLGKANTAEFATGGMMLHWGWTQNPWDHEVYCGVSSSGSAAALAAGLAVAATGSDTGGSIRMPASFCGIVGLKATYGRVSRHGLIPLSHSMDNIGPMARTVAGAALLLQAMSGHDPADPSTSRLPVPDFQAGLEEGVRGLVLGVPQHHFYEDLHPEVEAAMQAALRHLEGLGARLEPVAMPLARDLAAASAVVVAVESYALQAEVLRDRGHLISERPRRNIAAGAFYSAADYLQALQLRELWVRQVADVIKRVDALLTPTMATPAYPVEVWLQGDKQRMGRGMTYHWNLAGLPALSLPCGFTAGGLPVGLQVVARAFDEATLFRVAHAYEQSTDWHKRVPARYA